MLQNVDHMHSTSIKHGYVLQVAQCLYCWFVCTAVIRFIGVVRLGNGGVVEQGMTRVSLRSTQATLAEKNGLEMIGLSI